VWWVPLAFVMLSLVVLATAPVLVSARVRRLRREVVEVSDPAQLLVNHEEAALATQMLALGEIAGGIRDGAARYRTALAAERGYEVRLDSLVRVLGADPLERFVELRTEAAHWHAAVTPLVDPTSDGAAPAPALQRAAAAAVLTMAERLDARLERIATAQRDRIRAVERIDVLLPVGLVPFALSAALVVIWMSGRMVQLMRESEAGRQELARTLESRAALMRGVTHDLKNPLGAVLGYGELLVDDVVGSLTAEQRDIVGRMRRLVGVSLETIDDLLELSRAEAGQLSVDAVPTDVGQLVREIAGDYRASALAAGLALDPVVPEAPMVVMTDPARVRQVLGNLLSNAIKYTPAPGQIAVRVRQSDSRASDRGAEWLLISVADTGPGIPPAQRERIFEEFFRLPDTSATRSGAGVGLAISRRVARLLGGDLGVADAEGGGTVFTLRLPLRSPSETGSIGTRISQPEG
jgi:signal transduction histidine kinase